MLNLRCAEIWGGNSDRDIDLCTRTLVASFYSSAAEGGRGGDVHYLSVCGGDAVTRVALADVVGHGRAVSRISQWLYACLEARMGSLEGDRILADLNRLVIAGGVERMATVSLVGFYSEDSSAYLAYAGHHPTLLCRAGTRVWMPVEMGPAGRDSDDLPLGVISDATYRQERIELKSGDRLFLYTDGVTQAPNPAGERFGEGRLRATLDQCAGESLTDLKHALLEELLGFTQGPLTHDDLTLIAISMR